MVTKSQVKYIQSLGHKKFRDQEGMFVAEGPKIVEELLLASNMRVQQVYAVKGWSPPASFSGKQLMEVSESELGRISSLSTPNQVLGIFKKPSFSPPVFNKTLSLVLDGIQDPGNLGTIVRIADWFGIPRILCSPDCADVYNAKAMQSTMGSISRIPVIYGDPEAVIRQCPDLPVYAAVLEGKSLYETGRVGEGLIVIGNESRGIGPGLLELTTHRITIPRRGRAESLNAAVATGVILSHMASG